MNHYEVVLKSGERVRIELHKKSLLALIASLKAAPLAHGILTVSTTGQDADAVAFLRIEDVSTIYRVPAP